MKSLGQRDVLEKYVYGEKKLTKVVKLMLKLMPVRAVIYLTSSVCFWEDGLIWAVLYLDSNQCFHRELHNPYSALPAWMYHQDLGNGAALHPT